MSTTSKGNELRDNGGQYAVSLEKLCTCGHAKGSHLAGRNARSLGECIHHEVVRGAAVCACEGFKSSKSAK